MTDLELKQGLSLYTDQALQRQEAVKAGIMHQLNAGKTRRRRPVRLLAAAASVVLILSALAFTPPGRALAHAVGENLSALWETLFPPRELPVLPEGLEERPLHTPQVEAGESHPGFVLYADESLYTATWEEECYVIRPIPISYTREDAERDLAAQLEALSPQEAQDRIDQWIKQREDALSLLPPCRLELSHREGVTPQEDAESMREELGDIYEAVSDIASSYLLEGLFLHADNGTAWDAELLECHFVDDGQGGTYRICSYLFTEAIEGHGMRFNAMISSFQVLSTPDHAS
ncbi:hypothetical protein KQI82_01545 [Oscillibacter sp. MSJ-2]|uniref:DUF4367 domain-containing protein n=1 Tax=Dysosmobacter acutus TaxID=2841504 RepID=A0ABS6F633_9FIRM|nr:hypothetical protein [Dysosmobacter acutus]MBU5625617.1 hypothetical protein [Dysosmobacter acutus]